MLFESDAASDFGFLTGRVTLAFRQSPQNCSSSSLTRSGSVASIIDCLKVRLATQSAQTASPGILARLQLPEDQPNLLRDQRLKGFPNLPTLLPHEPQEVDTRITSGQ